MPVPLTPPDLGDAPATFSLWHVAVGERVAKGERLAEVLIPGVAVELQAPVAGILSEILVRPGEAFGPDAVLGFLHSDETPDD